MVTQLNRNAKKAETETAFDSALLSFISATTKGKKYARQCAEMAITHFKEHGDTIYCQRFLEAIEKHGKNYVRRAAYLNWLAAHSPIALEKGKLVKAKGDKAKQFDLDGALSTPFWEFAPEKETVIWDSDDFLAGLFAYINRYAKGDKRKAANDEAEATLKAVSDALAAFAPKEEPEEPVAEKAA